MKNRLLVQAPTALGSAGQATLPGDMVHQGPPKSMANAGHLLPSDQPSLRTCRKMMENVKAWNLELLQLEQPISICRLKKWDQALKPRHAAPIFDLEAFLEPAA